jgi:hypothetical protein
MSIMGFSPPPSLTSHQCTYNVSAPFFRSNQFFVSFASIGSFPRRDPFSFETSLFLVNIYLNFVFVFVLFCFVLACNDNVVAVVLQVVSYTTISEEETFVTVN